jgi:hypothetical protein
VAPQSSATGLIPSTASAKPQCFPVNGGDVSDGRTMGAAVIPNLDSVAEFRLITNNFDAEYGRFAAP